MRYLAPALTLMLATGAVAQTTTEKAQELATVVDTRGERSLKGWTLLRQDPQYNKEKQTCGITYLWRYNDFGLSQFRIDKYDCPQGRLAYRFDDHGANGPDDNDFVLSNGEMVRLGTLSNETKSLATKQYEEFVDSLYKRFTKTRN